MTRVTNIPSRLHSVEQGNIVAGANEIYDDTKKKKQNVINSETDTELLRLEQAKQDNLTFDNAPTENSNNPVKSGGVYAADLALQQAIEAILLLIPSAATALNQLADKNFVNSSISTATATFRGTYNVVTDLHLAVDATHAQIEAALASVVATADNNDYCYVQIPVSSSSQDIQKTSRYKFNGTAWVFEYDLNTSGFTAAQWAAINSGITAALVTKLGDLPTATELSIELQALSSAIGDEETRAKGVEQGLSIAVQGILNLIPSEATAVNQLADKTYVLASILAATPAFKGQFTTLAALEAVSSPKAGDIGIVRTIDSDGFAVFTFYQYLNNQWNVYYTLAHHLQNKPATTGTTGDYPYNGMGRVVIPKNMVDIAEEGEPENIVNLLTQAAFEDSDSNPLTNTIFVIQYDFVLDEDITIPANCVLEFEGGSVCNATGNTYKIIGNHTTFNYEVGYNIFHDVIFKGFDIPYLDIRWFGAVSGLTEVSTAVYTGVDCHDALVRAFMVSSYYMNLPIKFIGNFYLATKVDLTERTNYNIILEGCYHSSGSHVNNITLPDLFVANGITAFETGGLLGNISVDGVDGTTLGAGIGIKNLSVYGNGNGTFLDYYWVGGPVRHGYIIDSVITQFNKCISICVKEGTPYNFSTISHLSITQCQLIGTYAIFSENENLVNTEDASVITFLNNSTLYNPYGVLDSSIIEQNKILGKIHIDTPNGIIKVAYNSLESSTDCVWIRSAFGVEFIGNQFEGMHGDYIAKITGLFEQIGQAYSQTDNPRNSMPSLTIKDNYYCEGTWKDTNLPLLLYGYIFNADISNNMNVKIENYSRRCLSDGDRETLNSAFITPTGCVAKYASDVYDASVNPITLLENDNIGCILVNADTAVENLHKIKLDLANGGENQVIVVKVKFLSHKHCALSFLSNNGYATLPNRFMPIDISDIELYKWYTMFMTIHVASNEWEYLTLYERGNYLMSRPTIFGFGSTDIEEINIENLAYICNDSIGTTAIRNALTGLYAGFEYYDTDLGKKVVWNGSVWTNVDGSQLA